MPKGRLEAFSDGVIAIVITLLVLEIRIPQLPQHVGKSRSNQSPNPVGAQLCRVPYKLCRLCRLVGSASQFHP